MALQAIKYLRRWDGSVEQAATFKQATSPTTTRDVVRWELFKGSDTVEAGTISVALSSSPSTVKAGDEVTLSASVVGGEAPYAYTFTGPTGVTLSGSGSTRKFIAPTTTTDLTFRVTVTDSTAVTPITGSATVAVTVGTSTAGEVLYAGHIPGRVLLGFAAGSVRPEWAETRTLIRDAAEAQLLPRGPGAYERRWFSPTKMTGTTANTDTLRGMLADCDAAGVYAWISCKVAGNDWAGVAAGNYPDIVKMWQTLALERRTAGKGPFMATMHHEPRGDGSLSAWSDMHTYMSNQVASAVVDGKTIDLRPHIAWSCIGNGFLWNQVTGTTVVQQERADTFPQKLIDAFRTNKHVVAVDTYDDHPVYTGQETYPVGGQSNRTSVKLQNWIDWMRARNCGALGIGEWSTTDVGEMKKVAPVFWKNRDILGVANYFASIGGGSTWDWRIIDKDYAKLTTLAVDYGGTQLTHDRLYYFPVLLNESVSAANTT